jgi:outer membrane protein OmpA-like peptidoglycan-associated protein
MKKNIATFATGIAMPTKKQDFPYLLLLFLLLTTSILYGCSASKNNTTMHKAVSTKPTKARSLKFESPTQNNKLYGTVTDKNGAALKDVAVIFDAQNMASTDENGNFSFDTEKEIGKIYQLVFMKDGYNKAVRNYTLQMHDANYTIAMIQPCKCDTIICNTCYEKNVDFDFEKDSYTLNNKQKIALDALIECLKLHPEKEILILHNTMFPKRDIAKDRLQTVVKYFTQKGIMDYRVKQEMVSEKNTGAKQIEIISK